ncbi:MAG: RloB family protein [Terracidiphilus sp.]|jgi:hypothetical protein
MAKKDRQRAIGTGKPQAKRFLVVVEGAVTEPEYIEAVKRSRVMKSIQVLIETGHTDPIGIVNRAKEIRMKASKTEPFDQVWCVFDAEVKLTQQARFGLNTALDAAARSGICIAVSNPCFEIWLLWHTADHAAWIASDAVQRLCVERGVTVIEGGKHIQNVSALVENGYQAAKVRACNLDQAHDRNGTEKPEDRNPSSGVYKLIDAIYEAFPSRN